MDMKKVWWEQIAAARNYLINVCNSLRDGRSVAMILPENTPWKGDLLDALSQMATEYGLKGWKTYTLPENQDVGLFFFEKFVKKEVRSQYRLGKTYARFLAERRDITLNSRFVCLDNLSPGQMKSVADFISDYNKYVPQNESVGQFVLCGSESTPEITGIKNLDVFSYTDEIDSYDVLAFCRLAVAETKIPKWLKEYAAEVIASVCKPDVELCEMAVKRVELFLENPIAGIDTIVDKDRRSNGEAFSYENDDETVKRLIWRAQIRLIFPKLESYRTDFIERHEKELQSSLPIFDTFGNKISDACDLEVGMLVSLIGQNKLNIGSEEYHELWSVKEARNSLAHITPLNFDAVKDILRIIPE